MLKAGSYRGNDLFHCIIHLIDYAFLDTQADIDATFFENMLEEFADYYGIKNLTRDEIATLLKGFPHPFDREILLGEVLKRVFNKSLPNEKRSDSDELLKSEALRAFLTGIAGKWTYENGVITESISKMKIIHKDNGYFFNCGDDGDNDLYENLMNQPDAQLPEIVAGFRDKEKQKEAIRKVLYKRIEGKGEEDKLGFEAVRKKEKEAEKQPILNIRPENPRGSSSQLPQQSAHAAKDFDPFFLAKLQESFTDTKWNLEEKAKKVKFSKKGAKKEISIKQTDSRMQFTGTESSVAKAATLYQDYLANKSIKAVCEIEADTKEEAVDFMKKIAAAGFDIKQITEITCDGKKITDPKKLIEEAETTAAAAPKSGKKLIKIRMVVAKQPLDS